MNVQKKILMLSMLFVFSMTNMHAQSKSNQKKIDQFTKIDSNTDGKISKDEYVNFVQKSFKEKDKNQDGKLVSEECGKIERFDKNQDNKVTMEEFLSFKTTFFVEKDLNKDGFIDKKEFMVRPKMKMKPKK